MTAHSSHFTTAALPGDDDESVFATPLDPPGPLSDSGLPPTPPTMSQDMQPAENPSLASKKSTLSTPVNARSPPTPDPSPPRNAERPHVLTYPSSRAESFMTAREDPLSSEPSESRSLTPLGERLSTVEEDRGLGLAFEVDECDVTPTEGVLYGGAGDAMAGAQDDGEERVSEGEWNSEIMRNVTVRRKRITPRSSPSKRIHPHLALDTASPSPSPRPRRQSGLRERVEASTNSPVTPSIENFAAAIGWPSEERVVTDEKDRGREENSKRHSTSSIGSTVVEAKIIVTPPRRRQTLRRSGKNMAYRSEGSPTPDRTSRRSSNRQSSQSDEPLHRLVHKRVSLADRTKRISAESDTLGTERSVSTPLSFRSRIIDSSASTRAHQDSVRNVLQPAADILSRSSSVTRGVYDYAEHKRMVSAPETMRKSAPSSAPRAFSPPTSPRRAGNVSFQTPESPVPSTASPRSLKRRERSNVGEARQVDMNKRLPGIPADDVDAERDGFLGAGGPAEEVRPPLKMLERVRMLVARREMEEEMGEEMGAPLSNDTPLVVEQMRVSSPRQENSPPDAQLSPPKSDDRKPIRERASSSPKYPIRPSLDRRSTEEFGRKSHEWRRRSEEHGRVSFSSMRTEEYGDARHAYASTTPFSQFSDTPIEINEATSVSIIPHNNTSLLVVDQQHPSRVTSLIPEPRLNGHRTPTPPFVDAREAHDSPEHQQPTLTFQPSTPPTHSIDSPLQNPRPPPEPPLILFIPPTPAEELERQLPPGPPARSSSHPQRRLSLVQRARRYSDNLIPTLLGSQRKRVPNVSSEKEEDNALHPFWRPRGFWDDFEDEGSDGSESEDELHPGGDTSDVETLPEVATVKRRDALGRRLSLLRRRGERAGGGSGGAGGFLIGNSLGVERHGTNKRRHHISLPANFSRKTRTTETFGSPKILIQPPTFRGTPSLPARVSLSSLRDSREFERSNTGGGGRRTKWKSGRIGKYQVQYIGLSGVRERMRERGREKRREEIRRSIGARVYVE